MSVESEAKARYARVFVQNDWSLFKRMADLYLARAAKLLKRDIRDAPEDLQLLVRNAQKRLFLGVGVELLLKAAYLKHGFAVNRPAPGGPKVTFPFAHDGGVNLNPHDTYQLNDLIQSLHKIPGVGSLGAAEAGLRVAKVFRNKEGHVVSRRHRFVADEYREVERALKTVYERAFQERLSVRISMEPREKSVWRVSRIQ